MNKLLLLVMAVVLVGGCGGKQEPVQPSASDLTTPPPFAETKAKAEAGDARAQYNLGLMYDNGEGVEQDFKEAIKWYQKAADQGYAEWQCNLGVMYYEGKGVEQDFKEAIKWNQKAADQGYARAQNNLGVMYANGDGVEQNFVTGYAWWSIAATTGQQNAKKVYPNLPRQ